MNILLNLLSISVDWNRFAESFTYMAKGMLGIFIVITVLILGITLLNKFTSPKKIKKDKDDDE